MRQNKLSMLTSEIHCHILYPLQYNIISYKSLGLSVNDDQRHLIQLHIIY